MLFWILDLLIKLYLQDTLLLYEVVIKLLFTLFQKLCFDFAYLIEQWFFYKPQEDTSVDVTLSSLGVISKHFELNPFIIFTIITIKYSNLKGLLLFELLFCLDFLRLSFVLYFVQNVDCTPCFFKYRPLLVYLIKVKTLKSSFSQTLFDAQIFALS